MKHPVEIRYFPRTATTRQNSPAKHKKIETKKFVQADYL